MPDNTNNNDDSVMTFRGLGEMLQSGLFQAVGGVFSLLTENKPLEKLLFTFYGLVRDIQEDKLESDDETKQLVDDLIQAASKAQESLENPSSIAAMDQALTLLREAYEILRKQDPGPTWEELETAHTKLVDALDPLYTGSVKAYLKTPHTLVEVAFILSGVFLNPFQMDYEELEKELSSIGDKYVPFLEIRGDFDVLPALGSKAQGQLSTATAKLQWVSGQIAGGNIDRSTLSIPLRAAYNALLIAGKEEIERLLEELLPAADSLLGGVLEIFLHTGDQTLADEITEAMDIVILTGEMVNWCTFSLDSLQFKGELIALVLEEVQQYLEAHHDESRLITAICYLLDFIQDLKDGVVEQGRGIWSFLGTHTCIPARFDCTKAEATKLWDIYNNITLVFDAQHIEDQTAVLRDIRDLLQTMKDEQDALGVQVAENLAQQQEATRKYLENNEDLFEPPPLPGFDSFPFVELPQESIRKDQDGGAVDFFLPDGTLLRVSAAREFSAVIPGKEKVETLTILPQNVVRLSDGRTFRIMAESVPNPTEDEVITGLPDGSEVVVTVLTREAILPDGTRVRYYTAEDIVAVLMVDGSESLITFAEVRGLGCTGELHRVSDTLRRFRFSNQVIGTIDWETGFTIVLPSGVTVNIRREHSGIPGKLDDADDDSAHFSCQRRSS